LRLPHVADEVKLQVDGEIKPGARLRITGEMPDRLKGAWVILKLERPLTSEPAELVPVPAGPPEERDTIMLVNHLRANEFVLAEGVIWTDASRFETELQVPEKLPWANVVLRAWVQKVRTTSNSEPPKNAPDEPREAIGSLLLEVQKPAE